MPTRTRHPVGREVPGRLRIIGGRLRGSRIDVPDRRGLRPTPDRVRETLFNWLAPEIEGARCLDLFAGTGALGIEALSRGAAGCTFVEHDPGLAQAIGANLTRLHAAGGEVVVADAIGWLAREPRPFDIVFVDPPFDRELWAAALQALESGRWLAPRASIHVEHPRDLSLDAPGNWTVHRQGRAGAVGYDLFRRGVARDPVS